MAEEPPGFWVGKDEAGGIPNPGRPAAAPPPHWRWEAIAATGRPRSVDLAPDGRRAVMILDVDDRSDVWSIDVTTGSTDRLTTGRAPAPYWEDSAPAWSPDETVVAFTSGGGVWLAPAGGGPARRLTEGSAPQWLDARRLLVVVERDECSTLAVVHVDDPWPRRFAGGAGDVGAVSVAPDRTRVTFEQFPRADLNSCELHVVAAAGGPSRPLVAVAGMQARGPVWSPDGATIAFAGEAPGWFEVFTVATGGDAVSAPQQVTAEHADFTDLHWSPGGDQLVGIRTRAGVSDLVAVDLDGAVRVLAPGGVWSNPRLLPDGSVLACHEAPDVAPRLAVVGPDGTIRELFSSTPAAVRAAPYVLPTHVTYRSADGTEIGAWLYRPAGASAARPCPAVVEPHGGPTDHSGATWEPVAQYFVDKGYAWLQPNFRGSTSYGRDFERADHGVWGVADTADCLAAHDHLAALDWIDGRRIAIFGASYGSYMALCATVDDPEHRFACGVAKYGDCDVVTSWAQGDREGRLDLERMMGPPADAREAYRAASPIHRVEQLAVPLLIAHGEQDERVHPAQSVELVDALRRLGKPFEYVTYPTEAHGLLRAGPFVHFHGRLERFLDWYLM